MTPPKIAPMALADAIGHLYTDAVREVGGFFVGSITDGVVAIEASIPALAAQGSEVNLTFGHEVWTDTMALVDREFAGMQIVGWFHSHPGHGVFLSGYDEFIQTNFFPGDGMVAYVLDPHADRAGWFETRDGKIVELGTTDIQRPEGAVATASEVAQRRDRRGRLIMVGAATVLVGFVGGYLVANSSSESASTSSSDVAALEEQARAAESRAATAEGKLGAIEAFLSAAAANKAASEYTIVVGDTLWSIAAKKLGDGSRWQELYELNAETIGELGPSGGLPRSAIGVTIKLPTT